MQKKSCRYLALNIHNWEKCLCMQKQNLKPNSKRHFDFIVPGKDIKYSPQLLLRICNCSPHSDGEGCLKHRDLEMQRTSVRLPTPFSATSATADGLAQTIPAPAATLRMLHPARPPKIHRAVLCPFF